MTCRYFLTTQTYRKSIKRSKLQPTIARNARDRSFAIQIARNKRLNYVAFEVPLEIENIKWKTEFFSDSSRVVDVIERTTTGRQGVTVFVSVNSASLIPQLHSETNELVPLLFKNCGGCRRIKT